eukprot:TRINITY_DN709_c0_g1_i3.p2 TRINITY_DN709_c0_g1~~TRINITY_DN709_c0_g1_i3.p2  ORF type:complete len:110 (-),score=23.45 TRINITY_DN709_c0_g1_i3:450-779(-)
MKKLKEKKKAKWKAEVETLKQTSEASTISDIFSNKYLSFCKHNKLSVNEGETPQAESFVLPDESPHVLEKLSSFLLTLFPDIKSLPSKKGSPRVLVFASSAVRANDVYK